jgi:hypothetical protein
LLRPIIASVLDAQFAILDILTVSGGDTADRGRQGVVMQVRRYPDDKHVYSLGWMSDGETGGLYPEEWLETTGRRSSLEHHQSPGAFKIREVVRISPNGPDPIRGKQGHVDAGPASESDDQYAIWVEGMDEEWMVSETDLEPTGQRLPPPQPGPRSSLRVSVSGELLGRESYVVLDDLDWHL